MSRENLGRKRMKKENSRQKPTLVLRARLQAGFPDAPRRRLSGAFRRGRGGDPPSRGRRSCRGIRPRSRREARARGGARRGEEAPRRRSRRARREPNGWRRERASRVGEEGTARSATRETRVAPRPPHATNADVRRQGLVIWCTCRIESKLPPAVERLGRYSPRPRWETKLLDGSGFRAPRGTGSTARSTLHPAPLARRVGGGRERLVLSDGPAAARVSRRRAPRGQARV